ncbi:MAG: hypothetical protein DMF58_17665 [Acidobacteria bacterium]|nr:MAG: hypothetical protein DMF58_17665 [Acidobacteriota bacterium]
MVRDSVVTGSGADGIRVEASGGDVTATIEHTLTSKNGGAGLIGASSVSGAHLRMPARNVISIRNADQFSASSSSGGVVDFDMESCSAVGSGAFIGGGVGVRGTSSSSAVTIRVSNSTITVNTFGTAPTGAGTSILGRGTYVGGKRQQQRLHGQLQR